MADENKQQSGLAIYDGPKYAITAMDSGNIRETIAENIGDTEIGPNDLMRIGMPGSGGLTWQVPDPMTQEPSAVKEIEGVVIGQGTRRALWLVPFEESDGGPPACSSDDGRIGHGFLSLDQLNVASESGEAPPSRPCKTCPMNQWGSGKPRKGQHHSKSKACGERRVLFIMQRDSILPIVVSLAPTSIKPWRDFTLALTRQQISLHSVVVGLSLRVDKVEGASIKYSVVTPRVISKLSDEDAAAMASAREQMGDLFGSVSAADVVEQAQTYVA